MVRALNGEIPLNREVPLWELEFHAWEAAASAPVVLGERFANLPASEQEGVLYKNAETMWKVAERYDFSAITVPGGYWEQAPGEPAYFWLPEECRFRQIEVLKKLAPQNRMLVAGVGLVLAMPDASEFESFSYLLFDDPEAVEKLARQKFERGLETVKRVRDLGVNAVFTASDLAMNKGPFFSPAQMERFIYPYLRRFAELCRESDLFSILHSDGDISSLLPGLAYTGIHAVQAIDPTAGMSLTGAREFAGNQLCLIGNIDCGLLLAGTPEQIYRETLQLIGSAHGKGPFVLGASNAVQVEVPIENYEALVAARRDFQKG